MSQPAGDAPQLYRRVAMLATGLGIGLITLGGVVRILGAGMGCGDHWPLCNGRILPNLSDPLEVIEWSHRWVAAMVTAAVVGLALIAWRRHRGDVQLQTPAFLSLAVLVVQVLLGAVTVWLGTAAPAVVIHLTNAMFLVAGLAIASLRSGERLRGETSPPGPASFPALAASSLAFGVILLGAFVANYQAGMYCLGFPFCEGSGAAPPASSLGRLQWIHRVAAFLFLGGTIWIAASARRLQGEGAAAYRRAAWFMAAATVLQILVAWAMIVGMLPAWLRAAHLFAGSLVWLAAIVLVFRSRRVRSPEPALAGATPFPPQTGEGSGLALAAADLPEAAARPGILRDLLTLTKPRIISLLLLTTVAPMFITGQGLPPAALVFWVIVGGYLMAGGANSVNMWFDRDIDQLMSRTRLRPIPSGRIPAGAALGFGMAQGALAFWIFWHFVNPLSAWLAFGGYLFYIFVYTVWLKRLSPQNIVIGGAAGAFPPMVGWTAMTGTLDLPAVYLFAIIFFWTPPHFWALALLKRQEYARAGVPMMPVVQGEHWTKVQMLAYTLMLIPLTLMPTVFGALGLFYAAVALLLGGRLLWYCLRLLREAGVSATAMQMYRFSLLYLALLFAAMGVDRAVPFGHRFERAPLLILDRPETEALETGVGHDGH